MSQRPSSRLILMRIQFVAVVSRTATWFLHAHRPCLL